MIGAFLHTWLSKWILRVPSENFSNLPLFSVGDIPFWFVFRTEWVKYLRKLSLLKKNLTRRHWRGLGIVYPRVGVFAYCFYLFQWAEYCDQTDDLIAHPDNYIFAEVFLSYICQIDRLIDRAENKSIWAGNAINKIKLDPEIAHTAQELCLLINALPTPRTRKKILFRQVIAYRRQALQIMRRWSQRESEALANLLDDKKATACNLLPEWSRLLTTLHASSPEIEASAYALFQNFSFLVQIIDDVADCADDHRNHVQNIFIGIVQQHPEEWQILEALIRDGIRFVGWLWIAKNLPHSFAEMRQLYDDYAELLLSNPHRPHIARNMFKTIDTYRQFMRFNQ